MVLWSRVFPIWCMVEVVWCVFGKLFLVCDWKVLLWRAIVFGTNEVYYCVGMNILVCE